MRAQMVSVGVPLLAAVASCALLLSSTATKLWIVGIASGAVAAWQQILSSVRRLGAWLWSDGEPQFAWACPKAGDWRLEVRDLCIAFPGSYKVERINVRKATVCWPARKTGYQSLAPLAPRDGNGAGDGHNECDGKPQPNGSADSHARGRSQGVAILGLRVCVRASKVSSEDKPQQPATGHLWLTDAVQALKRGAMSVAVFGAAQLAPLVTRVLISVPVDVSDVQVYYKVSDKYPLTFSVLGGSGTASLIRNGTRLEAMCGNVAGVVTLGDTPVLAFAGERPAVQLEWHGTGIRLVAVQYERLLLAPQSRDVGKAAAMLRSSNRHRSDLPGQLVMRCASGTLWYDGWCLDAHSRSLVVEFQDKRTQLSARDLAACLEKEGGNQARDASWLTLLEAREAVCLELWPRPADAASQPSSSPPADGDAPSIPEDGDGRLSSRVSAGSQTGQPSKAPPEPEPDPAEPASGPSEQDLRDYIAAGLIRVRLRDAAMAAQQSSPQYKAASAALARLSNDLQTLAAQHAPAQIDSQSSAVPRSHPEAADSQAGSLQREQPSGQVAGKSDDRADAVGSATADDQQRSTGEQDQQATSSASASSVQVFVDGLNVKIDYSDASCSTLRYDSSSGTVSCTNAKATIVFKVLFQQVPVLAFKFCALSYDLSKHGLSIDVADLDAGRLGPVLLFHFAAKRVAYQHPTQMVELEGFATRYVGQALGGGDRWRGKLSAETDSRGQKVYRATRKVVVPPGLAFYSIYRSGAKATDGEDPEPAEEAAQQFGLVRLRGLDDAALPRGRSRLPRAGFGIDLLPAWKFGLRWDYAVESHL